MERKREGERENGEENCKGRGRKRMDTLERMRMGETERENKQRQIGEKTAKYSKEGHR